MDAQKEDQSEKQEPTTTEDGLVSPNESVRRNKDMNPTVLLLEDSTAQNLPDYVNSILSLMNERKSSAAELLSALIYCIALETGFASISSLKSLNDTETKYNTFWGYSFHSNNVSLLSSMPNNYRFSDENFIQHSIKLANNHSDKRCFLLNRQTGEFLIVTLTPEKLPGQSICLSISRYVHKLNRHNQSARFQNLKELSFSLKEKLFVPIRNCLMEGTEIYYPGLTGLPPEILILIFQRLSLRDVQQLSKTCWKLRNQCKEYYDTKYKAKSKDTRKK